MSTYLTRAWWIGRRDLTLRPDASPWTEGDEVVAAHELGQLLGVSRQRVGQMTDAPDFPAPVASLHLGRIWTKADIIDWARRTGRIVEDID